MKPFDVIAFDLDDTLLDTSRFLVPQASRESCEAMIHAGLATDLASCLQTRVSFLKQDPRGDVYTHLTQHFGSRLQPQTPTANNQIAQTGYDAFYSRQVDSSIRLSEATMQMLQKLKSDYKLFLVTAGAIKTQAQKVHILQIESFFEKIFYVDSFAKHETKQNVFAEISAQQNAPRCLSVGNRLDTDIAPAKILGWSTCWVKYGEYALMQPTGPGEKPDFNIDRIEELPSQCHL